MTRVIASWQSGMACSTHNDAQVRLHPDAAADVQLRPPVRRLRRLLHRPVLRLGLVIPLNRLRTVVGRASECLYSRPLSVPMKIQLSKCSEGWIYYTLQPESHHSPALLQGGRRAPARHWRLYWRRHRDRRRCACLLLAAPLEDPVSGVHAGSVLRACDGVRPAQVICHQTQ